MQVLIGGTDRTKNIRLNSLMIENILTRQVDRCSFVISSIHGFTPTIGAEVVVYDNDLTKIFGGIIAKISEAGDNYKIVNFNIDCLDYTRLLDRKLVNKSYENMTVNAIIEDIKDIYLTGDSFTINNVDCPVLVNYVGFKFEQVSTALQQLADLVSYDWYVDYDKDIHFFSKTSNTAPFDVQDDDGSYIYNTLVLRRDNSQVRNVVYVRGGEYLGSQFTSEIESDGTRIVYDIGYRYSELSVTLTGQPLNVGLDGIDSADSYDVLWNFQEKIIRFKEADKPSATATLRIGGKPYLPVIVKAKDQASIDYFSAQEGGSGEYEYIIIDNSIDSKAGARDRAKADLTAYKNTITEGEFSTYTSGLKAGQRIRINSTSRSIDEYYLINKVTYRMRTSDTFIYQVSLVSTRTFGIIEFLQGLLIGEKKKLIINADEVLDLVESPTETITLSETFTSAVEHNLQSETVSLSETFTGQSLDFETQFVLHGNAPTGFKRGFLLGGSTGGSKLTYS